MSRLRIDINAGTLDLFTGTDKSFYISKQLNDLHNLQNRQADYTRSITVPKSDNNRSLLGLRSNERIGNATVFCNVLLDDILVIPFGKILIVNETKKQCEIAIFSGNFDLFDNIPDINISNIDFSAYNFPWSIAGITAINNNSTGAVAINVWFNDTDSQLEVTGGASTHDIRNFGFGFYLKTITKEIIENAGYTYDDSLMSSDDVYQNLIMCVPVFAENLGEVLFNTETLSVAFVYDDTYLAIPERIPFDTTAAGSQAWWSDANKEFTTPSAGDYVATLLYGADYVRNTNDSFEIDLVVDGVIVDTDTYSVSGIHQGQLRFEGSLNSGVKVHALVRAGYQNSSKFDVVTIGTGSSFDLRQAGEDPSGGLVISDWLPEIKERDFLIGILSIFNAFIDSNPYTKTAKIVTWNDYTATAPQDLTANLDASKEVVRTASMAGYYRKSRMAYQKDSSVLTTLGEYLVDFDRDEALPISGTILAPPFGSTDINAVTKLMRIKRFTFSARETRGLTFNTGSSAFAFSNDTSLIKGDYIRYIGPVYDRLDRVQQVLTTKTGFVYDNYLYNVAGGDCEIIKVEDNEQSIRIGTIDLSDKLNKTLTVNGYGSDNSLTGVLMGATTFGPTMPYIYDTYYKSLFDALQTASIITCWMVFNTVEFSNLDLLKPVKIDGFNGNYYINKIDQYKLDQPCLVELIRINQFI